MAARPSTLREEYTRQLAACFDWHRRFTRATGPETLDCTLNRTTFNRFRASNGRHGPTIDLTIHLDVPDIDYAALQHFFPFSYLDQLDIKISSDSSVATTLHSFHRAVLASPVSFLWLEVPTFDIAIDALSATTTDYDERQLGLTVTDLETTPQHLVAFLAYLHRHHPTLEATDITISHLVVATPPAIAPALRRWMETRPSAIGLTVALTPSIRHLAHIPIRGISFWSLPFATHLHPQDADTIATALAAMTHLHFASFSKCPLSFRVPLVLLRALGRLPRLRGIWFNKTLPRSTDRAISPDLRDFIQLLRTPADTAPHAAIHFPALKAAYMSSIATHPPFFRLYPAPPPQDGHHFHKHLCHQLAIRHTSLQLGVSIGGTCYKVTGALRAWVYGVIQLAVLLSTAPRPRALPRGHDLRDNPVAYAIVRLCGPVATRRVQHALDQRFRCLTRPSAILGSDPDPDPDRPPPTKRRRTPYRPRPTPPRPPAVRPDNRTVPPIRNPRPPALLRHVVSFTVYN